MSISVGPTAVHLLPSQCESTPVDHASFGAMGTTDPKELKGPCCVADHVLPSQCQSSWNPCVSFSQMAGTHTSFGPVPRTEKNRTWSSLSGAVQLRPSQWGIAPFC